jgi:Flp pilus assembly protein TadG
VITTRLARCKRGATALEFALIAPPLLMLLVGTLDVGRLLWTRAALQDAVTRAARCVAVSPEICGNARDIGVFARESATKSAIGDAAFTLQRSFCGIQVRAQLGYHALVPFFGWLAPELEATACVP